MIINKNKISWIFYLVLILGPLYIYYPLIKRDPILKRDDNVLVEPLKLIHSFGSYKEKLLKDEILDFQPVRDLTYLLDIKLYQLLSISTFHASNVFYFYVILILLYHLLRRLQFNLYLSMSTTLLLSVHPLAVGSVAWVSGRKHILAAMFLLLTFLLLSPKKPDSQKNQNLIYSWISSVLSFFSHPMHLLTSTLSILLIRSHRWKVIYGTILFLTIAIAYQFHNFKHSKTLASNPIKIQNVIENFGFMATKSTGLVDYATNIQKGFTSSMIGLVMIISIFFLYYLINKNTKTVFRNLLFFFGICFFPVITYSRFQTMDTYVLIPGMMFFVLIVATFYSFRKKLLCPLFLLIYPTFIYRASNLSLTWISDIALWTHAFYLHPSPYNALNLANFNQYYRPESAIDLLLHYPITQKIYKDFTEAQINLYHYMLGRNLLYSKKYPMEAKEIIFANIQDKNRWGAFFAANYFLDQKNCKKALATANPFITKESDFIHYVMEIVPTYSLCDHMSKFAANASLSKDLDCIELKSKITNFYGPNCVEIKREN